MSYWTYVTGMVEVSPFGRTQAESLYILQTTLEHLPRISGSESDAQFHIVQRAGTNWSSGTDEFERPSDLLPRTHFGRSHDYQTQYYIVIESYLRDRHFQETYRETMKWLCRLAKRCLVYDILIRIQGHEKSAIIDDSTSCFKELYELPSFAKKNESTEPTWAEYLMWRGVDGRLGGFPAILAYKYFSDKDNDKRVEHWLSLEEHNQNE